MGEMGGDGDPATDGKLVIGNIDLLAGLLKDEESRAYGMLTEAGINGDCLHDRWPDAIHPVESGDEPSGPLELSPALRGAIRHVQNRCLGPTGGELATEHLLLALAWAEDEVAQWLSAEGLRGEDILARITEIYGDGGLDKASTWGPVIEPPEDFPSEDFQAAAQAPSSTESGATKHVETADSWAESNTTATLDEVPSAPTTSQAIEEAQQSPSITIDILRILDAAANRAIEALRVLEDFARFAMDDHFLTGEIKSLRHDLSDALKAVPPFERLACRDTGQDVGTTLTTEAERIRRMLDDVLVANFKRLQEALRSIEEYGKLMAESLASAAKGLRYKAYVLEQAVAVTRHNHKRLANCRLYVLVDGADSPKAFAAIVQQLVEAGVHAIQLRDKRLTDRELVDRALLLRQVTSGKDTIFIMNDRPDLAYLAGADGVHVGQDELNVRQVRKIVGPQVLVGVSTHSLKQAQQAVLDGADYLGMGPTFASSTKQFKQFPGLDLVRQISHEITLPAFAIGGITSDRLPEVLAAGAKRVAVSAAIAKSAEPGRAAAEMLEILR